MDLFNHHLYYYLPQFMIPYFFYYPHNIVVNHLDTRFNSLISLPTQNQFLNRPVIQRNQINENLKRQNNLSQVNGERKPEDKNSRTKIEKQRPKIRKVRSSKKNRNKSHCHQNQIRNIFSNIARLVINFVALEVKSKPYLTKILKNDYSQAQEVAISEFYKEALSCKKKIRTVYLSRSTFFQFLGLQINPRNSQYIQQLYDSLESQKFKKVFRKLAYFYCHSILIKQIIHSKKINPSLKQSHLKTANDLLNNLKSIQKL